MGSTWAYLDITALGRQEEWEDSPEGYPQTPPYQWWNSTTSTRSERVIAHVGGVPVEELLPSLPARARRRLLVARGWIMLRLRRRREPGT